MGMFSAFILSINLWLLSLSIYIYIHIYICVCVCIYPTFPLWAGYDARYICKGNTVVVVVGDPRALFSIATTTGLLHSTLDPYLIILSVKQGNIKYHFWVYGMNRRGNPSLRSHWCILLTRPMGLLPSG